MKNYILGFSAILLSSLMGFYIVQMSSESNSSQNSYRDVASVEGDSAYQKKLFSDALFQTKLINQIEIKKSDDESEKYIYLNGFSPSLCESFLVVNLNFEAYGIASSGEPIELMITAKCLTALDSNSGGSIKVPVSEIKKFNGSTSDIKFSGSNEIFRFKNMDNDWNKTWIMTKISFQSKNIYKEIKLNSYENDKFNYKPIVLEF